MRTQVREARCWEQGGSSGGGEKQRDSGRVLQVEQGFLVTWMWGMNEDKSQEWLGFHETG